MNVSKEEEDGVRSGAPRSILHGSPRAFHSTPRSALHAVWSGIRAGLRLIAFLLVSFALACAFLFLLPWAVLVPGRNPNRRARLRNWVFRTWSRIALACSGVRVDVRGRPPEGPCFLVSNHIVYLDIWVLASKTSAVFVAESGIASWPFFGFMARVLSIIFVNRLNNRTIPEVNQRMEEEFANGHVVALFPEGRTSGGTAMRPFRSPLLESAARNEHPVAWAAIGYRTSVSDPPASEVIPWPDGVPIRVQAARLLRLDRIEATVTFGEGTLRSSDRKALTADLQQRVEAIFTPMI
jgi:1-acyl-sn-glycerol-3-phosphate acyltransferase